MQRVQLVLDSNVRRLSHGTALLGGSPFRVIRLSRAGAKRLDTWLSDEVKSEASDLVESSDAGKLWRRLLDAGMVHPVPTASAHIASEITPAFVIPVHGDSRGHVDGLAELLERVRQEFVSERIIVVDDASSQTQPIAETAARFGAELIRHERNTGPAEARNTGCGVVLADQGSRPDAVVFLDADVRPAEGSISLLLAHLADENVLAVAPRVKADPGSTTLARYEAVNSPLDMGPEPAVVAAGSRVSYVPTAALAIRPAALEQHHGFANMRFGEDVDLVWRMLDAGQTIRYEPHAVVHHRIRASLQDVARQRFGYGSAAAPLATNHRDKIAPLQMPAELVATTLVALFGGPVSRVAALGVGAVQTKRLADKLAVLADDAPVEAARLRLRGHGYALTGLASAATRSWAPAMLLTRRSRRALAAAVVLPAVGQWLRQRPGNDPLSHVALRVLDHGSYCAGVWAGAWREQSGAALLPDVQFPDMKAKNADG